MALPRNGIGPRPIPAPTFGHRASALRQQVHQTGPRRPVGVPTPGSYRYGPRVPEAAIAALYGFGREDAGRAIGRPGMSRSDAAMRRRA